MNLKGSTTGPRASHVNSDTSVLREKLPWPEVRRRVLRMPAVQAEVDARSEVTPYGGLVLFNDVVRRFGIAKLIDEHVGVFKLHAPYHESDHVLTQAMSLFVGGSCLEDIAQLVLPAEVVRWEWKRFRLAWVYLAAHVTRMSRQIRLRLSGSHRFARDLLRAHEKLQT